jgi:hypothetical protein
MASNSFLLAMADLVLLVHFAIVLFVIGGLLLIFVGNLRQWLWVNHFWFRCLHLVAIGIIVLQAWLGQYCALTVLESWLRRQAGAAPYTRSFIEHWVQELLYYEAPFWVFVLAYTLFGLLVAFAWRAYPPQRKGQGG